MIRIITLLLFLGATLLGACWQENKTESAYSQSVTNKTYNASKVEIRKTGTRYQLFRDGKPYFIKGASGRTNLAMIKEAGGNSIRTYTADALDTLLERAHALDLSVAVGLYVGRELEGFDYHDKKAVQQQKERIRATVNRYKNHPAVLCWIVGNEPDIVTKNDKRLWLAINDLVDLIHQLDPDHPVTIAVHTSSANTVLERCPNIDFVAVNTFGHVADFAQNFKYDKPYLYSEWGSLGPWESKKTYWQAPLEESVQGKYVRIRYAYNYILKDSIRCLGSYVFYWGQKQEVTPTWFSFFLENGAKTMLVDIMYELWSQQKPPNYAPILDSLLINNEGSSLRRELQAGQKYNAIISSLDPENEPLTYNWEIIPEGPFTEFQMGIGYVEVRPRPLPDLILHKNKNTITFKAPEQTGAYRLLVQAYDEHQGGAYANMPFFVVNNLLTH
ncbi:MAG: glycoside hydrolase family 2 TIM barrel-domain containing protein [Saprospiraceae bacterium]